jgi:oxygen-independent coproporphyrinogen III oxidase
MIYPPPEQEKAGSPEAGPFGVYVHVPFCATTCDFCSFYQTVPKAGAVPRFLDGVAAEAALVEWGLRRASTAFWGGGTPGLLRPAELARLAEIQTGQVGLPAEWSVEMAPATVTADRLKVLREAGVTRVSMGVQSFRPEMLEALGRQHTVAQIERAYGLIREAGFASVNLDLMFALPNQTKEEWHSDLTEVVRLQPDHVSTYCLTFEEDTALWVKLAQGRARRDVNQEAEFYEHTWEFLGEAGYAQYEISNFARPGHVCLHNLNTWRMHEWVGLGPSAASQHGGWRGANPPDLNLWLEDVAAGRRAASDRLAATAELLAADSIVFGLRMNQGVHVPELQRRFPGAGWSGLFDLLPRLLAEGLVTSTQEGRVCLTSRGRMIADSVGAEILAAFDNPRDPASVAAGTANA